MAAKAQWQPAGRLPDGRHQEVALVGGLGGVEAWASGEGRRGRAMRAKKPPAHTRSEDVVDGSKRVIQRGSGRQYGLGQRAHAVASRGDEGAVVSLRQGALCKTYLLQTARNTALYVPSCALVLQP